MNGFFYLAFSIKLVESNKNKTQKKASSNDEASS